MGMAISVVRPTGGPRTCTKADGTPKAVYPTLALGRRVAKRQRGENVSAYTCPACGMVHIGHPSGPRDRRLVCVRCGSDDRTVATTTTSSGDEWPPFCSDCAAKVIRASKGGRS